jgi:DNA invertase Pin-like site-specific DNA recombinase
VTLKIRVVPFSQRQNPQKPGISPRLAGLQNRVYSNLRVLHECRRLYPGVVAEGPEDRQPAGRARGLAEAVPAQSRAVVRGSDSATNLQRDAFQKLQAAIFAGKITTVVVWKLDRLARSLKEGINVLADWCQRGVRVIAITQQIDLSGPVGHLIASLLFGIAEIELQHTKERQAVGIALVLQLGFILKFLHRKDRKLLVEDRDILSEVDGTR